MFRRTSLHLALTSLVLAGCECGPPPVAPDGSMPDGGLLDGTMPDGRIPGMDGGIPSELFPPPTITTCPGDALPPPASGRCEVTAGSAAMLLTGDVLTPGEVFRGGQVLVGTDGRIACVGCDCGAAPGATGATEVVCPDVVISPGLINAHDHVTFAGAWPYADTRPTTEGGLGSLLTEERYEHRHDWRGPVRGHTRIPSRGGMSSTGEMHWLELRQLISGTTSIFGSGGPDGFLRNLDSNTRNELPEPGAAYETFPLGDGRDENLLATGCGYPLCSGAVCGFNASDMAAFVPHVAEGIDAEARNEFTCLREGALDVVLPRSAFIHGVGLLPTDIAEMATEDVELIWSPRTNITLYGDTARVTEYAHLGVSIAMGTDWVATGSMNMLRELACADSFNSNNLAGFFPDEQLWLMATRNSARALGVDDHLGTLAVGQVADIALFDASTHRDHRAVLMAQPDDVVLVMVAGSVRFGDAAVVESIAPGCELIDDVCGEPKRACLADETCYVACAQTSGGVPQTPVPCTWEIVQNCGADQYPLFFCGDPADEPSCLPARTSMGPLPNASVNGSNYYAGMSTADDMDGDGILNDADNCPTIFNPIRPLDDGAQADFDADGLGDACDRCPLDADAATCSTTVDPNDRDGDTILDTVDNCPTVANTDQLDRDGDDIGDACDACPDAPNPGGAACPATIYEIKDGTIAIGGTVAITRSVVTAVGTDGFTMQVPTDHPDYAGADFSGVFVYVGAPPTLPDATPITRGMTIDVTGMVSDFFGQTQLTSPLIAASPTTSALPAPVAAEPGELDTAGARAAALEAVLVRVETVTVSNPMPAPTRAGGSAMGEFEVDSVLRVDDFFFTIDPFVTMDETFDAITGVLFHRDTRHKLMPRDADDYVAGAPQLAGLEPALSYARVGATVAPTFPMPLTVRLTRAPGTSTVVTIVSSGPADLIVTDVVVPAGSISAVVPVTAVTAGTYAITATLGAVMAMADVRVLAVDEAPADFMLAPATATVPLGGTFTFTVTLDIPAPSAGAQIDLSEDTSGTIPAMVVVPADATSATFDYIAPATETTGTLTAQLAGTSVIRTAALTVMMPTTANLIFSEYVEGNSNNKAIEIANIGGSDADLSVCMLRRYTNGATTSTNFSLSGTLAAGDVLVLCNGSLEGAATICDVTTGTINHNGDDAYDLLCDGMVVDTFGRIGEDPGTAWTGGGLSTLDYVLTRSCSVTTGDAMGMDAFDPSVEWQGAAWVSAAASLGGLGNRSECP